MECLVLTLGLVCEYYTGRIQIIAYISRPDVVGLELVTETSNIAIQF